MTPPAGSANTSLTELVRASWEASEDRRGRLFLFVFLFVIANFGELAIPWALGQMLETFATSGSSGAGGRKIVWWLGVFMALRILATAAHHFARYLQTTVAYSARMNSLLRVFGSFMRFPLSWHVRHHSGESLSKLNRSSGAVDSMIGTYVWQIIDGAVKTVFAALAICYLDFWVAVNVVVLAGFTLFVMVYFNRKLTQAIRNNNTFLNKVNRICVDYLFHVVTVKTLGLEDAATGYLKAQKEEGLGFQRRIATYSELKWGTTAAGYGVVMGTSLLIYFSSHSGAFRVSEAYVLLDYLNKFYQAMGSFTAYYGGIIESAVAYDDGREVIDAAEVVGDASLAPPVDPDWSVLHVRDLTFSYSAEKPGVSDLSLDIYRGDKIALVGPSGGGKSTLLKTLGGLLSPERYSISSDKESEIRIESVGRSALLVPQEPEIFSETLYYNLTMGETFADDEVAKFITLCRLDGVVSKLPDGVHTFLAENGLNLSVGEKQRVAMARGLLRAAGRDLLLLDEPTSSLDPKTEKEVFVNLLSAFPDRTIATACHRLNLVPLFDKIIHVAQGRVQETGTFDELMTSRGPFFESWVDYEKKVAKVA